jgi:hypothetical protein
MNLFVDGRVKRQCDWCGQSYRPHVPDQRYCGPYCRNKAKALEAKSARPREPGSDLTPSPEPPEVGANSVVPRNGREIVCDRLLWIAANIFGTCF